jgi:hypothetical protein
VSLDDLDASMFAPHPSGWLCRCGATHSGSPDGCTCPGDFPEAVAADLSGRIRHLEAIVAELTRRCERAAKVTTDPALYELLNDAGWKAEEAVLRPDGG